MAKNINNLDKTTSSNHTHNYAASNHSHGLLHDNFAVEVANTTTDNGWSMINSSYNGYLLKSMRFNANVPPWAAGGYGAGIAFGGGDTKGVMSMQYSSPLVKFAGGNGTKPVWNIGITGVSGKNYNLEDLNSLGGQLTLANGNIGTLSSLQTSNKGNLVAAINEVFQSGVSAKQKLVDALNAKGTEASTSMTWDALIELIGTLKGTITYTGTFLPIATGQQHTIIYRTADSTIWGAGYNYYGQLGLTPSTYNVFKNTGFTKENIKQIECGYSHTCILLNNGELHIAGYNKFGQFGINSTSTQFNYFKLVRSDVKYVSCGGQFTFIITNNDEVYAAGYNNSGQLGIAGTTTVMSFTKVPISNIIKIACGNNYTLALRNDGTVWVTGYNGYGSLGLGDKADRSAFTQVIGIEGAKDIFAGNSSINSYILTNDGSVYGMGENNYGSVGDGSYVSRIAPVKISSLSVTGATSPTAVKQIAVGYHFAVAVLNNGKVKVAGANHSGQIGLGTTPTQNSFITPSEISGKTIVGAACGYEHTILLASDNTIWGTGSSTLYQLGSGTDRTTFTSIYTL